MWKKVLPIIKQIGKKPDINLLQTAINDLDHGHLCTIVGDFNVGKTSLLNAMNTKQFAIGPIPTTSDVTFVKHTLKKSGIQIQLVDTPGTNSIYLEHDELSRRIMPRSDLILFVTSAERPLTRFDVERLKEIQEWSKHVVVIINKIDLLNKDDKTKVCSFVKAEVEKTFGHSVSLIESSISNSESLIKYLETEIPKIERKDTLTSITQNIAKKYTFQLQDVKSQHKTRLGKIHDLLNELNMLSPHSMSASELNQILEHKLDVKHRFLHPNTTETVDSDSDIYFRSILQSSCLGICGCAIGFVDLIHTGGALTCFAAASSTYSFNRYSHIAQTERIKQLNVENLIQQKTNIISEIAKGVLPEKKHIIKNINIIEDQLKILKS